MRKNLNRWIIRAVSVGLILLVWEVFGRSYFRVGILISTPTRISEYVWEEHARIGLDTAYTAMVSAAGFTGACIVGVTIAVVCFRVPRLRHSTVRVLQSVQVVPVLVFAPLVTVILGVGATAHMVISFSVGVFAFVALIIDALLAMPSGLLDLVKMYKIRFLPAVWRVYLPYVSPALFAAARVSATLCVVGTTVAEFTGSRYGLGRSVFEAAIRIEPEKMMVSTAGIILIGICFINISRVVEKRVIRWRH